MNDNEEYVLNTDNQSFEGKPSDTEKELMSDLQELSKKFMGSNIPCFLCAKFESSENPTAAWHFGASEQEALRVFSKDLAPLFLFLTSQVTGTKITAVNPSNGKTVYEVSPNEFPSDE